MYHRVRILGIAVGFVVAAVANSSVLACEATEMATTPDGFIHKVVAGSDKIKVFKTPAGKEEAYVSASPTRRTRSSIMGDTMIIRVACLS